MPRAQRGLLPILIAIASIAAQSASTRSPVTFTKDVAPILFQYCASCHQPERAAPFSLLSYDDARTHAPEIVAATSSRRMPPWLPKHAGAEFVGERRLSDAQIAILRRWLEEGTLEGDSRDLPAVPTWSSGWQLGEPDLVVTMADSYRVAATGADLYRNFVIPVPIAERRYVRAVELWPDNPRVIHHAVVTVDRTRWSRYRDEEDPEPGYDGMLAGRAESPDGHFLAWTPGRAVTPAPEDMAWRLDRGSDLVLQLHLMPTGRPEAVRVRAGLFFTDRPPARFPLMLRVGMKTIDIPPGARHYLAEDEFVLPVEVDVLSVYPHAHFLARTMVAFARLPDGAERPLLQIPAWNFHWQDEYRYVRPVRLPRGSAIVMRYSYDNSAANSHARHPPARVVYGPRSSDEMCDLWLQVLPRTAADRRVLESTFTRREMASDIAGFETLVRARPADARARTLLGTLYTRAGRLADAERQYRAALGADPNEWLTHFNLGATLQAAGRPEQALAEYRSALRLNPRAAEVHHGIGSIAYAAGRFDESTAAYNEALRIWPDYADAHCSLGSALAKTKRLTDAILEFRNAVAIQPDHLAALNNLGILLATHGEIDEAIQVLERAQALAPLDRTTRTNLAAATGLAKARRPRN